MIKYVPSLTDIVMEEIPHKVTLALEISNCQGNCIGCHSPFLREDIGEELTPEVIDRLIADNFGVNCVLLLGEGTDPDALKSIARSIREAHPGVDTALYSGRAEVEDELFELFDYVKVGPYIKEFGPLNNPGTNQRLYHHGEDITSVFWKTI
ncbi:MAG: radical SAM protein [Bacteroidales bacterium]|nr:radical SAM protein [Bacteroidales bacterium]